MTKSYSVLSETEVTSNVASVDISLGHGFLVHEIVYCDITLSATPQTLQLRLSDDNGSTFERILIFILVLTFMPTHSHAEGGGDADDRKQGATASRPRRGGRGTSS